MLFVFGVLGYFPDSRPALWVGAAWIALLAVAYRLWVRPAGEACAAVAAVQGE
ncbi:hypothetical protein D9M68_826970 [compost metagenome]